MVGAMTAAGDHPKGPPRRSPAVGNVSRRTTRRDPTRQSGPRRLSPAIREVSPPPVTPGPPRHRHLQITSTVREVSTYTAGLTYIRG